jgi:hypothetical protein
VAEGRDRPQTPEDGRELARPVGGAERLEDPRDEVVERRMHGVEPDRLPEERPVPRDPVRLENLVEAVREVIEPEEADRGGHD